MSESNYENELIYEAELLYKEIKILYHIGQYDMCERKILELSNNKIERPFALYNLSILYSHLNRPNWKDQYNEAIEIEPKLFDLITDDKKMLIPIPSVDKKLNNKFGNISLEDITTVTEDIKDESVEIIIKEIEEE